MYPFTEIIHLHSTIGLFNGTNRRQTYASNISINMALESTPMRFYHNNFKSLISLLSNEFCKIYIIELCHTTIHI